MPKLISVEDIISGGFLDNLCKVTFRRDENRIPMVGKFVMLKDGQDLKEKNMVRFVSQGKLDQWDGVNTSLTRVFVPSSFQSILLMQESKMLFVNG